MATCRRYAPIIAGLACLVLAPGAAIGGSFENEVRARWRGAWVVLGTEVYSSCSGGYHANKLSGTLVTNRGGYRFLPGELGKVRKVQLKKKKVELMVTLDVPFLVSFQDGPFTLYDERVCAVSLQIQIPRNMTKARDVEGIDRLADELVERFDTRETATASGRWNEREREPYPPDYDLTLARHAAWKAEQHNLAVDRKLHVAMEQVKSTGKAIGDDPDYLQGLAAGVEEMRRWDVQECRQLMAKRFESVRKKVPEEREGDEDDDQLWRKGYDDGQRLVYNIALLERLESCYVPVPPVPGEAQQLIDDLSLRVPDSEGPR